MVFSRNHLSARQVDYARAVLIVLLVLLVYLPAMRAGFIWDDDRYVTGNSFVQSEQGLPYIWLSARTRDYYPVLYTSFWAEWRLWGSNSTGYHLTNVLLHAANSILIWIILARMGIPGAWLCGLLFALHPVNVESVAWISQRKNTLGLFFYFLCFLAFPWREDSRRCLGYCSALILFALSLLTRPIAIMFPLVIPVYRWWKDRVPLSRALLDSLPFFAVSGICGAMTVVFQRAHSLKGVAVGALTLPGKLLTASRALIFYVGKTLLPLDLCAVYPEWETDRLTVSAVLPFAIILLISILLYRKRRTWGRPLVFAGSYFVLMLFPVLGFLDVGFMFYAMVADHWVYPALPALLAVVVGPGAHILGNRSERVRRTAVALASAAVILMGTLSFFQCRLYTDMPTLCGDTIAKNPRAWVAHVILGNAAFSEGDLTRAETHFRIALNEKPGYWEAQNGLGIVFAVRGRLDEAIEMFSAVLAAKPEHSKARQNLELARRQKAALGDE